MLKTFKNTLTQSFAQSLYSRIQELGFKTISRNDVYKLHIAKNNSNDNIELHRVYLAIIQIYNNKARAYNYSVTKDKISKYISIIVERNEENQNEKFNELRAFLLNDFENLDNYIVNNRSLQEEAQSKSQMSSRKRIFIGCSSRNVEINNEIQYEINLLLKGLFKGDCDLVFGGNINGIMGKSYEVAKFHNRKVTAICPEIYASNLTKLHCDEVVITHTVAERTEEMYKRADVLVFLPGGTGTFYELLAAIECKRGQEFDKPIIIFNYHGFFNNLLLSLEELYDKGFADKSIKDLYCVFTDAWDVINYIRKGGKDKEYIKESN